MALFIKEALAAAPPCEPIPGAPAGAPCAVPISGLNQIFANIIGVVLGFAGIAFFVLLLMGGFQWLTSGGDPAKLQGARNTLTYAIGGLVLLVLAYLILVFISRFTGVPSILRFSVTP